VEINSAKKLSGFFRALSWLKIVVDIHEDYFLDKLKSEREYFINFKNNELIEAMDNLDDMNVLEKVRYISPY
jgi:hypothetical protein